MTERLDLDFGHEEIDHGTSDDYYTPPFIFDGLKLTFDMDVCSPPNGSPWIPAKRFLSIIEDGLATDWNGKVWMNPPYSNPTPWVEKWLNHGDGICLVAVSRAKWYDRLWSECGGILNLPPSLKFMTPDGKSKGIFMPCVLAAIGDENVEALLKSNLGVMR